MGAYDLDGVEMYAGDFGWTNNAALQLRELAAKVQQGGSFSTPGTLSAAEELAMVERWAKHAVGPEVGSTDRRATA